jgi:hypothetical protein
MRDLDGTFLSEVLGQVLEDAAFVFVEPADEPEAWGPPVLAASLAFESVQGGTLRITAAPAAGVELAANMLGVDPADPEAAEHGLAALAEILNVVGGAFVTRYFGTAVPSQLGLPVPEVLQGEPRPTHRTCAATVRLESGAPLRLELDLELA